MTSKIGDDAERNGGAGVQEMEKRKTENFCNDTNFTNASLNMRKRSRRTQILRCLSGAFMSRVHFCIRFCAAIDCTVAHDSNTSL